MRALAGTGFNAVFANMLWAGVAMAKARCCPCERVARVRRPARALSGGGRAAGRPGPRVEGVLATWRARAARVPRRAEKRRPLPGRSLGRATREWLCPSREENFALERDALLEVVRNYAVAGIHCITVRYPDAASCFCGACRAGFEKRIGAKTAAWPGDVLEGKLRASFRQYRRDTITRLVRSVATQARALRPGIKISAAVSPRR